MTTELSREKKEQIAKLVEAYEERKRDYGIIGVKLQEHQAQVLPAIRQTTILDGKEVPKKKYILFQGGNGSGKTFVLMYIVVCLALGDLAESYKLPYIGVRRKIWVVTKSGENVRGVIEPYLLGDYSKTRIPKEMIKKTTYDNGTLKRIILTNGTVIDIKTYDQGRERLQGGNPDFIGVDEEPTNKGVWDELMVRAREFNSQLFLSMTPLSGLDTPVYEFFYNNENGDNERRQTFLVASTDNKHADHSGLLMMNEQDRKARLYGLFTPTTGLVFHQFNRHNHVVPHFDPKVLGFGTKYYAGLDFGVNHPTAFILLAIDTDGHIFAFDGFCKSDMLLEDIASEIKRLKREYNIDLEYIIADSAAKRERTELARLGIKTTSADKFSKGENGESNRKASILKVNQLFYDNKLYVSDKLKQSLVKELEGHHYKDGGKDGDVVKEQDDFVDALRYVIFSLKPTKVKSKAVEKFEEKFKVKHNNKHYYASNYKQPY